ncbi:hypothetical protein FEE95_18765 [Maribacter algarum]|uniref:Uncharacterized protein n=1 Tax=Maribacter algarum (ex Zhang et al. 2020) TaxID=2578118 RepID=A0A5S3PI63_9FLAO|nr:DUF6452 family protein [Maribacter algarum]TMM53937.1 hypothetical protein FEE95_18765 [Maribacter algarum]
MNRFQLILIFLLCIAFSACEKDDICVDGDTPLLIIRFYDSENPTEFKAVPGLRVVGAGNDTPVDTFTDRSSLDSISIPLKTIETLTNFSFISDSADDTNEVETGNADALGFSYETKEEFVSRACGFVVNYENLSSNFTTAPENWIQSIEIIKTTVQLETEETTAHVKVFH